MSVPRTQSNETIDVGGEIVVQCLEGQVAITDSATTQNLHAGELLYLPTEGPHSLKGVEDASLLLSIQLPHKDREGRASSAQTPSLDLSQENEAMHARGVLLSVTQAAVLATALALLFFAVAGNIFAGVVVVGAALVMLGFLHYWTWGRWMTSAPEQSEPPSR